MNGQEQDGIMEELKDLMRSMLLPGRAPKHPKANHTEVVFWEAPAPDPAKVRIRTQIRVEGEPVFVGYVTYLRKDWERLSAEEKRAILEKNRRTFLENVVEAETDIMEELEEAEDAEL